MVDYFSFEDVMAELELSEEDLKRMVSEGELRAFRDENKMKFKKEDVDNLKKGRITEPTIILPSTPGGSQDETVLDLDIGQETASLSAETSESKAVSARPPSRPAEDDLLVNTDEEKAPEQEETFIEEESDTGLTTEPLKLADEVEAAETVESETVTEEVSAAPKRASRGRRAAAAVPMATEEEIEKRRAHPIWTVFLVLAFVLAGYSGFFVNDLLMMETGKQEQPSGLTGGLARWTLDQFWGDKEWVKFHAREMPGGSQTRATVTADVARPLPTPKPEEEWIQGPSFMKPDRAPSQWTQ
jgi:hypothetical protein